MAAGYILGALILFFFFLIPIGLIIFDNIKKKTKILLALIPISITSVFTIYVVIDNINRDHLYQEFPQVNQISFKHSSSAVRDSISALTFLMKKLPYRTNHDNVQYSIDKHVDRHNTFSFNWFPIDNLDFLEIDDNLREYRISSQNKEDWIKYVSSDLLPFDNLSKEEAKCFIGLINFLSENNLTSLEINSRGITLNYCDSLRLSVNTGFRQIRLDTANYYNPERHHIHDIKDGFYLISRH
jgi:hypothetical protein